MVTAAAAGTWRLGDLRVSRLGFGAMRLTGDFAGDGPPVTTEPVGEHFAALAALRLTDEDLALLAALALC